MIKYVCVDCRNEQYSSARTNVVCKECGSDNMRRWENQGK